MAMYEYYRKKTNFKKILKDLFLLYLIVVIFVSCFNAFLFQAFKIPSNSMEPQLNENSLIIANKFIYGIKLPFSDKKLFYSIKKIKRGDVIVFLSEDYMKKSRLFRAVSSFIYILTFSLVDIYNFGKNKSDILPTIYIKRVIGLPGDIIKYEINDNKISVLINGVPEEKIIGSKYVIKKEIVYDPILADLNLIKNEYRVKNNEFYVLGDNREASVDSRIWNHGIKSEQIIGKAILKYYPKLELIK